MGALGATFCAKIRSLNCDGAAMCESNISAARRGVPLLCANAWEAFVVCLDANASSITCADLASTPPAMCVEQYDATRSCGRGADGGTTESQSGTIDVWIEGSASMQSVGLIAQAGPPPPACEPRAVFGACRLVDCPRTNDERARVSVGEFRVRAGGVQVAQRPNAANEYPIRTATLPAGSAAMVEVEGAGMAPSVAETLIVPATDEPMRIVQPLDDAVVERSQGLRVEWASEAYGTVRFELGALGGAHAVCEFPASARREVIPSELLAMLPAGRVALSAQQVSETRRSAAGWQFTVTMLRSNIVDGPRFELR